MLYYALGSILFAGAMLAAFTVMAQEFRYYWRAMIAALRSLSLDGVAVESTKTPMVKSVASIRSPLPRAA